MTDPLLPGGAGLPNERLDPPGYGQPEAGREGTPAASEPGGAARPAPGSRPTDGQPLGRKGKLIAILILVVPLAIILWAVKDNVTSDDLKVGDCFNVPSGTTVSTIQHFPCTETHTAEVIHVTKFTDDGSYPISFRFDSFVQTACIPVFQTYVGTDIDSAPDLSIGYFFPSRDTWSSGDRVITCYVVRKDEGPMTKSVKGSASS